MNPDFQSDIDSIARIAAVPTILDVVCRATGLGFAAVARVTEDRWVACAVLDKINFGMRPGDELRLESTICYEIRRHHRPIVINHVAEDPDFRHHRTPAVYGFQSYISLPIILADGTFFGTLCAMDRHPHRLDTAENAGMFELFVQLIATHLDTARQLLASEETLKEERAIAVLREQFIAVLGHDLRNPVAAIDAAAQLLLRTPLNQKAVNLVRLMQASTARMTTLIENVLDFARGRLGGGLTLDRESGVPLDLLLNHVVTELRMTWPSRAIEADFHIPGAIPCDPHRLAQLLSNLLGNALIHGDPAQPVRVLAHTVGNNFQLSVTNGGKPIPPVVMQRLFQPFFRGEVRDSLQGLGLGLYIASEIARAHHGTLTATSTPEETRFTFEMPL